MPVKNWKIAAAAAYALLPAACMNPGAVAPNGSDAAGRSPDATIVIRGVT